MARVDLDKLTHFNVRCEIDIRKEAEASAKEYGQSLSEWVRRAMKEKLERENLLKLVAAQRVNPDTPGSTEERLSALEQKLEALIQCAVITRVSERDKRVYDEYMDANANAKE